MQTYFFESYLKLLYPQDIKVPDVLYHYCSLKTFTSIIESKSIRLSNGFLMNDMKEHVYFYDLCKKWCNENYKELNSNQQKAINHFWSLSDYLQTPFYCMCFCENGDLLSQWRGYGDEGTGVSIGLNLNALNFQYGYPGVNVGKLDIRIIDVEYNLDKQNKFVNELFGMITEEPINLTNVDLIVNDIPAIACKFKHPGFSEEKEWRLVSRIMAFSNNTSPKETLEIIAGGKKPKIEVVNKQLVSYFEYAFEEAFTKTTLPQLYLGPRSSINNFNLRLFLNEYNLQDITIEKSQIPFR